MSDELCSSCEVSISAESLESSSQSSSYASSDNSSRKNQPTDFAATNGSQTSDQDLRDIPRR